MDQQSHVQRCRNCGTDWTPPDLPLAAGQSEPIACPVCGFYEIAEQHATPDHILTPDEVEIEMARLLDEARASGIPADVLIKMLCREIEFNAEMLHRGHHFLVEVIDLGASELNLPPASRPLRLDVLHGEGPRG